MNKQENKELFYSFFDQLKPEHAEKAKANYDPAWHGSCSPIETHSDALSYGFSWHNSPEGSDFWLDVDRELAKKTYPLQMTPRSCKAAAMERMATKEDMDKLEDVIEESLASALPTDAAARKEHPVYSGFINYFPHAIAAVSHLSYKGNQQHHPDKPLHWDMDKSSDELDAMMRHVIDGDWEQVAWRALANLERKLTGTCQYENAKKGIK